MGLFAKLFKRKKKKAEPEFVETPAENEVIAQAPEQVAPANEEPMMETPTNEEPIPESVPAEVSAVENSSVEAPTAEESVAQEAPIVEAEKAPQVNEKPAIKKKAVKKEEKTATGKYEFHLEEDGYHFFLLANNGQVLFDSPSFTTLAGAISGISTFQKVVEENEFCIKKDKFNRYRFILANKYYGENYDTKEQCQKSAESVKNFANNSKIMEFVPSPESLSAFETASKQKKQVSDIDWKAIEAKEAAATKMGKFEICREEDAFCFYLLANNGQILYSSRYFSTEAACRKGIDSFKRATYVGNFFVDPDKFGTYRFVLKNIGSAPAFIGESYENRAQCEKIIESVKNFVVTASIVNSINEEE